MATRKLIVEVVGDASKLNKTFKNVETRTQRFGRNLKAIDTASTSGKGGVMSLLTGRGAAIASGAGITALALKTVTDAASREQVILGQTSVAVNDAGISWDRNSKTIQDSAARISKSSSFDDEQVLQSFSVFVRGQKDVAKSIKLSELAANVARGRYTDLATATQLVNKAALGQIGALRRAGIQIDANADSTQALNALQRAYGNSAAKYAKTAAGAQDRLRVSFENLQETVGKGLLPVLTATFDALSEITDEAAKVGEALKAIGVKGSDITKAFKASIVATPGLGLVVGEAAAINKLFGGGKKTPAPISVPVTRGIVAPGEGSLRPSGVIVVQPPDVYLDGQKISANTTRHQQTSARRNPKQKRGG